MGTVAETRHGLIITTTAPANRHPDTLAHTAIVASLVEPLLYRDTLLGVIGVDHETPVGSSHPRTRISSDSSRPRRPSPSRTPGCTSRSKTRATLERQVQERTQDLEFALRLAEAASRAKASSSRTCRTSFARPERILGFSELMLRQGQTLPREKQVRFLTNIHTSGQRLLELVSQLLDYTSAQGGGLGLDRRSLSLRAPWDEVLGEVRPSRRRRG